MIAILLAVMLLLFAGIRRRRQEDDAATWLCKDTTTALNGFWITVVFLSHANQYIVKGGYRYEAFGDGVYRFLFGVIGQLMVAMFLFNSGFGVMESIKARGDAYVRSMPRRRLLATLLNFDIAVLAFIAMNIILGVSMTPSQIVGSFFCWSDVGNSNWYIFTILFCYASAYLAFSLFRKYAHAVIFLTVLLILYLVVMPVLKEKSCWYNTILGFAVGAVVSWRRGQMFDFVRKHYWSCICFLGGCFVIGLPLSWRFPLHGLSHNAITVVFVLISAILLTKYDLTGGLLWCGKCLFPIYIYERIPMTVFADALASHPVVFILVSAAITAAIASVYKYWRVSFD